MQPPKILPFRGELLSSSVTVETQPTVLAETALGDETAVRLVTGVAGRWGDDAVHAEWARPGQDLLVVCTGRPVRLEQVLLRTPEHDPRRAALDLSFKAVQPAGRAHQTTAHRTAVLDQLSAPLCDWPLMGLRCASGPHHHFIEAHPG